MPTTPGGLPYPAPTDPVSGTDDALKALAEKVEADYLKESTVASGFIATSETTTSSAYTDLATVGPAQTVTVGASGRVLVLPAASLANNTAGGFAIMSVALTGATVQAASDNNALSLADAQGRQGTCHVLTGLTPGSTTFTAKYRVSAGTGTFAARRLTVIPL